MRAVLHAFWNFLFFLVPLQVRISSNCECGSLLPICTTTKELDSSAGHGSGVRSSVVRMPLYFWTPCDVTGLGATITLCRAKASGYFSFTVLDVVYNSKNGSHVAGAIVLRFDQFSVRFTQEKPMIIYWNIFLRSTQANVEHQFVSRFASYLDVGFAQGFLKPRLPSGLHML